MQRHEMMTAMADLGLKGMAGAFDEAVTTGLQRKRTKIGGEAIPENGAERRQDGRHQRALHRRRRTDRRRNAHGVFRRHERADRPGAARAVKLAP